MCSVAHGYTRSRVDGFAGCSSESLIRVGTQPKGCASHPALIQPHSTHSGLARTQHSNGPTRHIPHSAPQATLHYMYMYMYCMQYYSAHPLCSCVPSTRNAHHHMTGSHIDASDLTEATPRLLPHLPPHLAASTSSLCVQVM